MANDTINMLHEYLDYIIAPPMEKRVIFQRSLSREILLSSLGRSEPPLMITARNILTSGYFLQSS